MRKQFLIFVIRWILNSFGIWIAVRLLGTGLSEDALNSHLSLVFMAGFIFSILNSVLRPILLILSLPMILVSLGLFILFLNGFVVWLAIGLTPGLEMTFVNSIFAGMILSLVNYIVSGTLELKRLEK